MKRKNEVKRFVKQELGPDPDDEITNSIIRIFCENSFDESRMNAKKDSDIVFTILQSSKFPPWFDYSVSTIVDQVEDQARFL